MSPAIVSADPLRRRKNLLDMIPMFQAPGGQRAGIYAPTLPPDGDQARRFFDSRTPGGTGTYAPSPSGNNVALSRISDFFFRDPAAHGEAPDVGAVAPPPAGATPAPVAPPSTVAKTQFQVPSPPAAAAAVPPPAVAPPAATPIPATPIPATPPAPAAPMAFIRRPTGSISGIGPAKEGKEAFPIFGRAAGMATVPARPDELTATQNQDLATMGPGAKTYRDATTGMEVTAPADVAARIGANDAAARAADASQSPRPNILWNTPASPNAATQAIARANTAANAAIDAPGLAAGQAAKARMFDDAATPGTRIGRAAARLFQRQDQEAAQGRNIQTIGAEGAAQAGVQREKSRGEIGAAHEGAEGEKAKADAARIYQQANRETISAEKMAEFYERQETVRAYEIARISDAKEKASAEQFERVWQAAEKEDDLGNMIAIAQQSKGDMSAYYRQSTQMKILSEVARLAPKADKNQKIAIATAIGNANGNLDQLDASTKALIASLKK